MGALPHPSQITHPIIVTKFLSQKDIAIGPDRVPVRAWHSWGNRAMPAQVRRRSNPPRWMFHEWPRPALEPRAAEDGRPTLDEGQPENIDRLLERLREVHGSAAAKEKAGQAHLAVRDRSSGSLAIFAPYPEPRRA